MPVSHEHSDRPQDESLKADVSSSESSNSSPTNSRRTAKIRRLRKGTFLLSSSTDLTARPSDSRGGPETDERLPLLSSAPRYTKARTDGRSTPKPRMSRHQSASGSLVPTRHHSRAGSFSQRLVKALKADRLKSRAFDHDGVHDSRESHGSAANFEIDDRVWYDQFTSTDWVHDNIADAFRLKELRSRKDIRGRLFATFDGAQGWLLCALVGCITAMIAYLVDVSESPAFDLKDGYCANGWYKSEKTCCPQGAPCDSWMSWSTRLGHPLLSEDATEFLVFLFFCILFSTLACLLTLTTKTTVSSTFKLSTLDENLGALDRSTILPSSPDSVHSPRQAKTVQEPMPPMTYYSASGSGVAEVKVILSGFVLHGFLGLKTVVIKTLGLILSVASGLSLGKEGPFVHIAACVGNIACRLFSKYDRNDGKRREILSAAAASGVAVAFGAPIGGVLFSLEEASYFFPAKTLFRTFFCCICAALTLKALNPYGTHKVAMFEVRYLSDWEFFEMIPFIGLGMIGGACGALFIKASSFWARSFRKIKVIKRWPLLEVISVALVTGIISYWSPLTKSAVAKLLLGLARPCSAAQLDEMGICPTEVGEIMSVIRRLAVAFVIKGFLTIITFGIKVPAGIYVPSMVVGGLLGRTVGHLVQYTVLKFPHAAVFSHCAAHSSGMSCVTPGVYALITAGATMCGVTRLSVTLAVILFELTGSLDYVLPFSLSILVAKWTADAIEPLSIYDLLTNMNSYPFLNNKTKPIFTGDLGDIVPRVRAERVIDISHSPTISALALREKLQVLHEAGELDGGLPIVRDDVLVGLIPAPDLEFALDSLESVEDAHPNQMCLMTTVRRFDDDDGQEPDPTDFTPYIDPAPMALDIRSPMDLVYECFAKLGLRYICVLTDGQYAGMLHRKMFVHYVRELEEAER